MKKASYEGRTRQVIGSEKRVRPYSKSVMSDADSLCQKNSNTQRSYDKLLIEWVRSGRVRASWPEPNIFPSGPPTQSVSIYHLPKINVQEKKYYDPGFLSWGMLNYIPRVGVPEVVAWNFCNRGFEINLKGILSVLTVVYFLFRFILRNYIAQNAIEAAESGDFTVVRRS